jgi:hypothetical protein
LGLFFTHPLKIHQFKGGIHQIANKEGQHKREVNGLYQKMYEGQKHQIGKHFKGHGAEKMGLKFVWVGRYGSYQ